MAFNIIAYRALRKLINGRVVLACAIFDDMSYREGAGAVDIIKRYALNSMREMPMDTLLGGGVQWMKEELVEAIMQDQDMNVEKFTCSRSSTPGRWPTLPSACPRRIDWQSTSG